MTRVRLPPLLLASIAVLNACQQLRGELPPPRPKEKSGTFRAGAAKVDLTPSPGFPMGGFSLIGQTARGYWTRLWARTIYLEDADGVAIALVACDLWGIPAGLVDRVAELVARDEAARHLGRAQLLIAASHTHHSPGNFSTSPMYNAFASHRAGFDERLFELLAQRIAESVAAAARSAQPAVATWDERAQGGLARNRSFAAFLLNPDYPELLRANAALDIGDVGAHVSSSDTYRAVDPTLTLLRVAPAQAPAELLGAAAFFAVHNTAMGAKTEVYSADVFGVATTLAEQALGTEARAAPIVALFNGAEGDVSPNWLAQDRANTVRIGAALAGGIVELARAQGRALTTDGAAPSAVEGGALRRRGPRVSYQFALASIAGRRFEPVPGVVRQTAAQARPGASALGGAEDGRSPLYAMGWDEGIRGHHQVGHGPKQQHYDAWRLTLDPPWYARLLGALLPAVPDAPRVLPLAVYRVGDLVIGTLPGEFTTMMGRRTAAGIRTALTESDRPPARVVLAGLANEYLSYFATPEEYAAQHYEGAMTIYGTESGPLVAYELARLASQLASGNADHTGPFHYDTGFRRHFDLTAVGTEPQRADEGLANVIQSLDTGLPVRDFPHFVWEDALPLWRRPYREALTPSVHIEARGEAGSWQRLRVDGANEDDTGLRFVTVALAAEPPGSKWAAIWMAPAGVDDGPLRFHVRRIDGADVCSDAFTLPGGPEPWRPNAAGC